VRIPATVVFPTPGGPVRISAPNAPGGIRTRAARLKRPPL
jgi:hypothetical protein